MNTNSEIKEIETTTYSEDMVISNVVIVETNTRLKEICDLFSTDLHMIFLHKRIWNVNNVNMNSEIIEIETILKTWYFRM